MRTRNLNTGLLALAVMGGYYLWRNRYQIQQFLESRGVDLPIDTSSIRNSFRSGLAKAKGSAEHVSQEPSRDVSESFRQTG